MEELEKEIREFIQDKATEVMNSKVTNDDKLDKIDLLWDIDKFIKNRHKNRKREEIER